VKHIGRIVGLAGTAALVLAPALAVSPAGAEPSSVVFTTVGTSEWIVPAGVTCVTAEAIGAEGGSGSGFDGDVDAAAATNGGSPSAALVGEGAPGGSGTSTFPVVPGASLQVNVGGRGGDVVDTREGEAPPAGAPGGFNGGGDGGTPSEANDVNGYSSGAGGGGASDVRVGGTDLDHRIAIGGGGGGFGGFGGEAAGIGGGETGGDAASGGSTGGTGGTQVAGGIGGATGGTAPVGGDGALGQGGAGAGDATTNGGGGGGGGGYYGGGGGGGVRVGLGAAAAGGGGSALGWNSTASGVDAGNGGNGRVTLTYTVGDTSCASAPLTVKKVATGPTTPGQTFTMHVECSEASIALGDSEVGSVDLQFAVDASGVVQPAGGQSIGFYGPTDCTVTETAAGGATSTSYACIGSGANEPMESAEAASRWDGAGTATATNPDDPCQTSGPQAAPMGVDIVEPGQEATVTVTNVLPAAAIGLQPRFTG
jgi:hypothetical protein